MGCRIVVSNEDGKYTVEGNSCKRGEKYAVEEITNPKRILTSTIRIEGSYLNLLPVKTDGAVPKELIMSIMSVLNNIKVKSPVKIGDIIIKDVLGTGVNIVSTKSL